MGTHPIFESDFDCLTEKNDEPTGASHYQGGRLRLVEVFIFHWPNHDHPRLHGHGNPPSPHSAPSANQAPWINILDDKMPWESTGKKTPFFHDDYNTIAQKGYLDGNNAGGLVPNQEHH